MLNKVILMGRLTSDPDVRQTTNGVSVTNFTLAVDRGYAKQGEEKETDFINIVCWRGTADFAGKYFSKGQLIAVEGSLRVRDYTDKDGNKRYATEVVANEVFFAESKRSSDNTSSAPVAQNEAAFAQLAESYERVNFEGDGDLPF